MLIISKLRSQLKISATIEAGRLAEGNATEVDYEKILKFLEQTVLRLMQETNAISNYRRYYTCCYL